MFDPRVSPIPGEKGRFLAKSDEDKRISYMVDLLSKNGEGECDCEAFIFTAMKARAQGKIGELRDCKHIRRCRRVHQIMEFLGLYESHNHENHTRKKGNQLQASDTAQGAW